MRLNNPLFAWKTVVCLTLCAGIAGCGTSPKKGPGGYVPDGGGTPALTLDPPEVTLDLYANMAPPTTTFTVSYSPDGITSQDVGSIASLVLDDLTLGAMMENVFTASGAHGGTTRLVATYMGATGQLSVSSLIHIKVHGTFKAADCANCKPFPDDNAPACPAGAAAKLVYPQDGVLLPPNLSQFEIHFTRGNVGTAWEVAFKNSTTDVRVTTSCPAVTDSRQTAVSGGCLLPIDPQWDFIAKSNKGGDPIAVTVRTTTDGACATPASNATSFSIAEEDTTGGIYYWKSKFTPMGSGGDIWRKSFGTVMPEEKITPDSLAGNFTDYPCWGCHSLSRDGSRMMINVDDSDSDDEYGDVSAGLFDVVKKSFITKVSYSGGMVPGFQTFNNTASLVLGSDGDGLGSRGAGGFGNSGATNLFFLWKGTDGSSATPDHVNVGAMGARPTMPDWSLDNKQLVFVLPTKAGWGTGGLFGGQQGDDAHVFGGSIWLLPYSGGFGKAVELIHSTGDNNYYPSFSPDSSYIVYNHVEKQATPGGAIDGCKPKSGSFAGSCPNDSFSNPKARLFAVSPSVGSTPVDLELANGSPKGAPIDYSNSWPRWSPFVQQYKGSRLLWITFSSTRDYGLRVRNSAPVNGMAQQQCYPADSAEDPGGAHGEGIAANCRQPQLWMAAINISGGEQGQVGDPSFPAFWLPYQDIGTHNHTAQWTTTIVNMPGGDCARSGDNCTSKPCCPNEGVCLANGMCGVP